MQREINSVPPGETDPKITTEKERREDFPGGRRDPVAPVNGEESRSSSEGKRKDRKERDERYIKGQPYFERRKGGVRSPHN